MPSFEETNQADQNNPDFQYKPGTQGDLEKTDVVVENSDEAAPIQEQPNRAKEAQRAEVPAELKPDVLDASIPLPKPAPLQRTKVAKVEDSDAVKKPNLRSRWKSDPSNESKTKAHAFGAVDDLTEVKENLSGQPTRPHIKRASHTTDRQEKQREDTQNKSKRSRNPRDNQKKRSHSERGDEHKRSEHGSSTKKTARKQAHHKTSSTRQSASKRRGKEPTSLIGKIVKSIKGLFAAEPPEPEPRPSPRKRPAKKRARNHRRNPGGRATHNAESNEGRPAAKKRSRRRRRPNQQKPEGGNGQASNSQVDPS